MLSLSRHIRRAPPALTRRLATVAQIKRKPKEEGSISSIFTTLAPGEEHAALPGRFSVLKKEIFKDELVESWRQVLTELEGTVPDIMERGSGVSIDQLSECHYTLRSRQYSFDLAGC
jgi:hypothetical protein